MVVTPNAGFEALLAEAIEPMVAAQQAAVQLEHARMAAALEPAIKQVVTELENTALMAEIMHQQIQSTALVLNSLAPTIQAILRPPVLQAMAEVTEALQGATALQASVQEVTGVIELAADIATTPSVQTTTAYTGSDIPVADAVWMDIQAASPRLPHEVVQSHLDVAGLAASVASFSTQGITNPELRPITASVVTAVVVKYLGDLQPLDIVGVIGFITFVLEVLTFFISKE